MLEGHVEHRLKTMLESRGFKVLKLTTPGTMGSPDRMILRPKWSPGAPSFVELKRPGKTPRRLQVEVRNKWIARGLIVHEPVSTYEEVDDLYNTLMNICTKERIDGIG